MLCSRKTVKKKKKRENLKAYKLIKSGIKQSKREISEYR